MEGRESLLILFIHWWYFYIPHRLFSMSKVAVILVVDAFSVKIIFRTLFAPWRRDELSYENLSLKERFSVYLLNLASRLVGFFVKSATLIAFLIVTILILLFVLASFIAWLAFPLLVVLLTILGIANI